MAKTDNLDDFLVDVADAIRAKKGTSDLINPQDFSTEIESIEGGGGSGGDEWVYYDVRTQENKAIFSIIAQTLPHYLVAILEYGDPKLQHGIQYEAYLSNNPSNIGLGNVLGFAYLVSHKSKAGDMEITGREYVALIAQQFDAVDILESTPRITKEQFYDLSN